MELDDTLPFWSVDFTTSFSTHVNLPQFINRSIGDIIDIEGVKMMLVSNVDSDGHVKVVVL